MREDEYGICSAMAEGRDVPARERVHHKARTSIARSAMAFVQNHGQDYPDKSAALEAFKQQLAEEKHSQAPCSREGHTNVVGFPILTSIFISLCCFFFQRWWARTFPND